MRYRIGLFSKIGRTTIKTIRFYEEENLLLPLEVDVETGYRYYGSTELIRLHQIMSLRQIGFSIQEIKKILFNQNIDELMQEKQIGLRKDIKDIQERLSKLEHYISERGVQEKMKYQAVLKEIPEYIMYHKRMILPTYEDHFTMIPALGELVEKTNPTLKCVEPNYCYTVYYDSEHREKDVDLELFEAVTDYGVEVEELKFSLIPATMVVTTLHQGSYKNILFAYDFLYGWIEENGYEIVGAVRENQIDGIWNKETEEEWLTEIQMPIKKKTF